MLATAVGLVALRTTGVSFMIVTMMFAQACFLLMLYFNDVTRGDEGIVLSRKRAGGVFAGLPFDLTIPRSATTWRCCCSRARCSVRLPWSARAFGRVLVAIRENEERTRMLGYDTFRYKLLALALPAPLAGAAGAAYALLFAYVGSTFASIEYSILPLLWVLLGGAGTVLGPIRRHAADVLSGRVDQRRTPRPIARGRRRAGAADPVLPQGHRRHPARRYAPWLP